jgi:hypothetical protein
MRRRDRGYAQRKTRRGPGYYDEYERLKDSLEVLSDPDLMKQIRRSKSFYAKGKQGMSFEAVFRDPLHARKQQKPLARE